MNLVDSSGWMEYFINGPQAAVFSKPINDTHQLIVPTICLYEVFKKTLQNFDEFKALEVMSVMNLGKVVVLDEQTAFIAAQLSHQWKLPMADSIIMATAQIHNAVVWTQDSHFKDLPDVKFIAKN